MKKLKDLDISFTKITNKSCDYLSKFDALRLLTLSGDNIDDVGLKKLGEMPDLDYLSISYTQVKDIAHSLKMNNLYRLGLEGLTLRREDFKKLANLKKLNYINMSDADYDPEDLFLLESPSLDHIACNNPKITEAQMARLKKRFAIVDLEKPHFSSYL